MAQVSLKSLIAPTYYDVFAAYTDDKSGISDFWLEGGRGSGKSTLASIMMPFSIMRDASLGKVTNGICFRKVANTLRQSVYEQMIKSIEMLGCSHLWKTGLSPLRLTYKPNGAQVLFEGCDDASKLKSISVSKGYIKYIEFEEIPEFSGIEEIRSVLQSVARGGDIFKICFCFNPPKSISNWANAEIRIKAPGKMTHHSTYLDIPKAWLGEKFIREAEFLKSVNPSAYEHEYMGIATGTGGQIFRNVKIQTISDLAIRTQFERQACGLDWGFAADPLGIIWVNWQPKQRRLYLFDEEYIYGAANTVAAERIHSRKWRKPVVCDNAEPKSIADINALGVRGVPCRKGKGSIDRGMRWLISEVSEIIIDSERCPNAVREFTSYEFPPDPNGGFKSIYPDKNNHLIDPTRYACQDWMSFTRIR